jgi:hypothetical protein
MLVQSGTQVEIINQRGIAPMCRRRNFSKKNVLHSFRLIFITIIFIFLSKKPFKIYWSKWTETSSSQGMFMSHACDFVQTSQDK